jgi:methyl-accepting chemotaxis protein
VRRTADAFAKSSREISVAVERVAAGIEPVGRQADGALREARVTLQEFSASSRTLLTELTGAVQRLERDTGSLARRTDDAVDVGTHELRATSEELRASIELISRTLDRLQDPRALLVGPSPLQMGPGEETRR